MSPCNNQFDRPFGVHSSLLDAWCLPLPRVAGPIIVRGVVTSVITAMRVRVQVS